MSSLLWLLCLCCVPIALCDDCNQVTSSTRVCSDEGQVCIVQVSTISLSNTGRVHICRGGQWGLVATENFTVPWSSKNAQVACRQAGFRGGALNSMYPLTGSFSEVFPFFPVHYVGVSCGGSESSLLECIIRNGSGLGITPGAVFVVCRPETADYSDVHEPGVQNGDLRLYGDRTNGWGAVEVYTPSLGGWVSICPDGFDNGDAAVVCRQFGYETGLSIPYSISPQAISSSRSLYDTECTDLDPSNIGSIDTIVAGKCRFLYTPFCPSGSSLYGGVRCSSRPSLTDGSIRLLGSNGITTGLTSGIVEVFYNDRWGMVCEGGMFAISEARAVCEQLGLDEDDASIMSAVSLLDEESRMKAIWLTRVDCGTSDNVFTECQRVSPIGYGDCSGTQRIAAVRCGSPTSDDGGFSSGGITGIIIAVIFIIFFVIPLGYYFGIDYWKKRHQYSWYNTMTTPSEWCDCCSSPSVNSQRTFELQREITVEAPETTNTEPAPEPVAFGGFGTPSNSTAVATEPSPETNELENPGLSKVPPPAYNASENFPSFTSKPQDLPPPYPGLSVGFVFPPTTLNEATALPAAGSPGYPSQTSNQDPAYPPPTVGLSVEPTAPPPSTGYPQDPAYPPPPPLAGQELPYPVNIQYGGGAYPPPTVQIDSSDS